MKLDGSSIALNTEVGNLATYDVAV